MWRDNKYFGKSSEFCCLICCGKNISIAFCMYLTIIHTTVNKFWFIQQCYFLIKKISTSNQQVVQYLWELFLYPLRYLMHLLTWLTIISVHILQMAATSFYCFIITLIVLFQCSLIVRNGCYRARGGKHYIITGPGQWGRCHCNVGRQEINRSAWSPWHAGHEKQNEVGSKHDYLDQVYLWNDQLERTMVVFIKLLSLLIFYRKIVLSSIN